MNLPKELSGTWWAIKSFVPFFCKQEEAPRKDENGCYIFKKGSSIDVGWKLRDEVFTVNNTCYTISDFPFPTDEELFEGLTEIIINQDGTYEVYEYI